MIRALPYLYYREPLIVFCFVLLLSAKVDSGIKDTIKSIHLTFASDLKFEQK